MICHQITSLSAREASFFSYLNKKMSQQRRNYVNTNYGYIKNVLQYKNIQGSRYLVKNLAKKKLITVEERTNWNGRQYLRIKIAKPIVVKRLLEAYAAQTSMEREEAPHKAAKTPKHKNMLKIKN